MTNSQQNEQKGFFFHPTLFCLHAVQCAQPFSATSSKAREKAARRTEPLPRCKAEQMAGNEAVRRPEQDKLTTLAARLRYFTPLLRIKCHAVKTSSQIPDNGSETGHVHIQTKWTMTPSFMGERMPSSGNFASFLSPALIIPFR
ncbi:hypothetical protein VZT92_016485 [Zoarces viviparus]|uniref:Uncharacterized protein n=1 Tax=Zoarces viviparus TaxID=48416 RepID=A0AAW1EU00_ZOAVI